jgi:2-haloacid dehalogenase
VPAPPLKALVFDAYGTLYDVMSVQSACERSFPGRGQALSELWRSKQLEYTWLRSLMGRYEDFEAVTEAGLRGACRSLGLELGEPARRELMDSYLRLSAYAEVPGALERLSRRRALAILSNGSPRMLEAVTAHNGLSGRFGAILSVDDVRIFKPSPRVYQLAVERLAAAPGEIGFVSSNFWDAAGAKSFGFYVFWINRFRRPREELGQSPDREVSSLTEIAELMENSA